MRGALAHWSSGTDKSFGFILADIPKSWPQETAVISLTAEMARALHGHVEGCVHHFDTGPISQLFDAITLSRCCQVGQIVTYHLVFPRFKSRMHPRPPDEPNGDVRFYNCRTRSTHKCTILSRRVATRCSSPSLTLQLWRCGAYVAICQPVAHLTYQNVLSTHAIIKIVQLTRLADESLTSRQFSIQQ